MLFTGIIERTNSVTIDGYSNRKTLTAAIKDMGRTVARLVDKSEGDFIVNYPEECLVSAKDSCGGFFLEIEEAPCASNYNEETEEMEYAEANWYICCRVVK